ncbi:MAG: glycoside hydrolase family 97 protein [Flavitalea sp.]
MKIIYLVCLALLSNHFCNGQKYRLLSPDSKTEINVTDGNGFSYSVNHNGVTLLNASPIGLSVHGKAGIENDVRLSRKEQYSVNETIYPVVHEKRKAINDHYNELKLNLKSGLTLTFRAYNNGVAYRWETRFKERITIDSELVTYSFSPKDTVFYPEEVSFYSHNERLYIRYAVKDISDSKMASLPALVSTTGNIKLLVTESDLYDYAGLWLKGSSGASLIGTHPNYPLEEKETSEYGRKIIRRADYVAQTDGSRTFPWRILGIAEKDGDLLNNQLSYQLATKTTADFSWVKPGKVSWDWWNASNIYGVDFKSGINTATYKYYIDFAAKYGLGYIILDEGWSKYDDLLTLNPDINMDELSSYAKEKKVGLILWVTWLNLDKQFDSALKQFSKWDIKGVKVDFMQRDDQEMVNFYERVAKATAQYHMLVDFHGSFKPTGLQRKYPNALTSEGVFGNENSKGDSKKRIDPDHNVTLPFIRMVAGPMDYTPGAMLNAPKADWAPISNRPMSLGTRCQQLAMYVVFESPLQMLCDNPSNYYREQECMDFLSRVPTVWEETIPQDSKVGEYVTVARQAASGDWYIGAMTNWSARELTISLSFLDDGPYSMEIYQDGVNADRMAQDYKKTIRTVKKGDIVAASLAPGGGWVARLFKVDKK